jgi:hypothetical protein
VKIDHIEELNLSVWLNLSDIVESSWPVKPYRVRPLSQAMTDQMDVRKRPLLCVTRRSTGENNEIKVTEAIT